MYKIAKNYPEQWHTNALDTRVSQSVIYILLPQFDYKQLVAVFLLAWTKICQINSKIYQLMLYVCVMFLNVWFLIIWTFWHFWQSFTEYLRKTTEGSEPFSRIFYLSWLFVILPHLDLLFHLASLHDMPYSFENLAIPYQQEEEYILNSGIKFLNLLTYITETRNYIKEIKC